MLHVCVQVRVRRGMSIENATQCAWSGLFIWVLKCFPEPRGRLGQTRSSKESAASDGFLVPARSMLHCSGHEKKKARLREPCFVLVPRRGLGHTSATPASVASDALRVLARSVLRCSGHEKRNGPLARAMFCTGAQKRTRTSTPCGTRT